MASPDSLDDPWTFSPTPWESYAYSPNDLAGETHPADSVSYAEHYWTPSSVEVDALGRVISSVARNMLSDGEDPPAWTAQDLVTLTDYDIRGNVTAVTDPRGNVAATTVYDLLNRRWRTHSIDAGDSVVAYDAASQPRERRDMRGALTLTAFDELQRPTRLWARDDDTLAMGLRQHTIYGDDSVDGPTNPHFSNRRGKVYLAYDEAGVIEFESYDFKGNVLSKERTTVSPLKLMPSGSLLGSDPYAIWRTDWESAADPLDSRISFSTAATFDALNRVTSVTLPDGVLTPTYNRAGALKAVDFDGDTYVEHIAYNARGQRTLVAYGNEVMTRYAYDPETFRLRRMRSEGFTKSGTTYQTGGTKFQDLGYAYDLDGNILAILDKGPVGTENANTSVSTVQDGFPYPIPTSNTYLRSFSYDAVGRLVSAMGSAHGSRDVSDPWSDLSTFSQDLNSVEKFLEKYTYDENSNLTQLHHTLYGTNQHTYVRDYTIDSGSNRLDSMDIGATTYTYAHDVAGNLAQENLDRKMSWDHANRLRCFKVQTGTATPSKFAQYLYDGSGERVLKVYTDGSGVSTVTVVIDGIFEHRERHTGGLFGGWTTNSEVHITDGAQRIARRRYGTAFPTDSSPAVEYTLNDHLGSSSVTLDGSGANVKYEEYTPYGESSFGSYAKKRYRFTGKEKDEESGLHYHSARYYAPWLCRWTASDPAGMVDGPNLYGYVLGNPLSRIDPGGRESNEVGGMSHIDGTESGPTNAQTGARHHRKSLMRMALSSCWSVVSIRWLAHFDDRGHSSEHGHFKGTDL